MRSLFPLLNPAPARGRARVGALSHDEITEDHDGAKED